MRPSIPLPRCWRHAAVIALTWAVCTSTAAITIAQGAGTRVALLVGVNKYDNKRNFKDLNFAERDVEELAADLRKARYEIHLLTGSSQGETRATRKNIQAAMNTVFTGRTKADLVLIALSGHGVQIDVTNEQGAKQAESFFCPADAEAGNAKTMLGMGTLFAEIDRRGGGRNLVLVDACRFDSTRRGLDGRTVKNLPEGVAVLFGCSAGQKCYETSKAGGGHGVFFHAVLQGLQGGARKNSSGELTWGSLVEYVSERVETDVERFVGKKAEPQTPNLVTNVRGRSPVLVPHIEANGSMAGARPGQVRSDNELHMQFCWCPAGAFVMGSPASEPQRQKDEAQVQVRLTRGYWLGKYEVTQGEWERIMHTTVRQQRDDTVDKPALSGEGAHYPMYYVNHNAATEFCGKLTDQERKAGRLSPDWEYRLPSEAQWEYACRAGTKGATAFGDKLSSREANFDGNYPYQGAGKGVYLSRLVPVGSYQANAWGLHDMHGNVREWCRDWYKETLPGGTDPEGATAASNHVIRGGDWFNDGRLCRSAVRTSDGPTRCGNGLGLRVALVQTSK